MTPANTADVGLEPSTAESGAPRAATVLFVVPTIARSAGGPTHTLAQYLAALADRGVRATVAPTRPSPEDLRWLAEHAPGATIRTFAGLGGGAFLTSPALVAWVAAHVHRFDVVHVFGTLNPISSLASRIAVWRGAPTVVCALGTASD